MIFKGVINKIFFFLKFGHVGAIQTYIQADSDEEYVQPRRRVPATNSHHQDDYNSSYSIMSCHICSWERFLFLSACFIGFFWK